MDRSKSRTDLLAAGKKKLLQYRQKKDKEAKGGSSRGKSSKKSSKAQLSETDAESDTASRASFSTVSSQVTDGNVETDGDFNVVIDESLNSQSLAISSAPDNVDPPVDSSSVAITYDSGNEPELDSNAKLALQGHEVNENDSELPAQDQGVNSQNVDAGGAKDMSFKTSNSQGETTYDQSSEPVAILSPAASVTTAVDESVTVEREGVKMEKPLLLSEDIPNTVVVYTGEDQEADGLDMRKSRQSTDAVIGDQKELPLFEAGESDQSLSGSAFEITRIGEASHEAELNKPVELFSSLEGTVSDKLSGSDEGYVDIERETLPGSSYDKMILQPNQEQSSKGVRSGQDVVLHEGPNQQGTLVGSAVDDPTHKLSLGASASSSDLLPHFDVSSINLSQLAEIIRGLSDEDCQFLVKAREEVSDADPLASVSVLPGHDFSEAFQRLKEELFLANLMKNISDTQLAEQLKLQSDSDNRHYQLIGELSQLHESHNEVNENNQHLSEKLASCHVELQNNSSKSVELQNQFNTAMADVEALSAKVVELQINFDMSQKDSLDLSLELADCRSLISSLQDEKKGMDETLDLVIGEKNKLAEEKEFHLSESKKLMAELADIKSSMEEVKVENSNLIDRISLVTEESNQIKAEIQHLLHEIDRLSSDLAENKDLVASLQEEDSKLNGNLALSADKIKNLEDENQSVVLENQRLSSQIVALQEKSSIEEGERMRFEGDLKEATRHLEQLRKENVLLNSTLDEHKAKIEEYGKKDSQPLSQPGDLGNQAHIGWDQSKGLKIKITKDSLHMDQGPDEAAPGGPFVKMPEHEVFNDSLGFVSLDICLNEVEKVLVMLEKEIRELHSRSLFSGISGKKVSSPVVSKLIQAFESKVSEDEHEVETENVSQSNSFIMLTNLRKLLSKWKLEVQNASALFREERDGRTIGEAKYSDLNDQLEGLKQHCSDLEASNIELVVQYETVKELLGDIQEKKWHLEEICEALKQEDMHCKAKNNELYEKLGNWHSKISELRTETYDVKQSSNEMASVIGSQLENLQKAVMERAMQLEQGWNTFIAEIVELVGKLNESVGGTLHATASSDSRDGLDISHRLEASVNAATEMIFDLRKKFEASNSDHEITATSYKEMTLKCDHLLGRNEMASGVLHKMYSDLRKLMLISGGSLDKDNIDEQSETLPDLLNYNSYETIMKHLGGILNEKLELESLTKEMESELMHRKTELEELKMKSLGLDSVEKLIDSVAGVLNVETSNVDQYKSPLAYLDSLVSMLVQRTKEAEIQYHTTKGDIGSKEMELAELKENVYYLETLRLENENEIFVLKESLHQAEEALTAVRAQMREKANELEHSEQRVSSIREKLGIAVAKGKGLVVQRDGLKQSLAETSSELERCLQELNSKDTRLHELETKIKSYSEAGERVEALESELSYIRNSANALRESFLLKDSMLQRIEEVLEDLDLPEQFHSSDIIEKIDWLVRSVVGNSLPVTDWEQKGSAGPMTDWEQKDSAGPMTHWEQNDSAVPMTDWEQKDSAGPMTDWVQKDSAGGGSYSDAGYVVRDSWKDDNQLQPDAADDFSKSFEELQGKYYGLAEQNEMLEQSLMERNSLVQRWEELVDKIDMPSHLRSMEMEDRIEWVGRALAEANHHVDSLQLKLEKYDSYCGLLNADLVESQRRVSNLQEDLRALASERDHLSEKMEANLEETQRKVSALQEDLKALTSERDHLSEKMEADLEESQRKVSALQEDLKALASERDHLSEKTEAELEESQRKVFALQEDLRALTSERDHLYEKMAALMHEYDKLSVQTSEAELENEKLHSDISILKEKLEQKVSALQEDLKALASERDHLSEKMEAELEGSQRKVSAIQEDLRALTSERDHLSEKMEALMHDYDKLSVQTSKAELENEKLHNDISILKEKLEQKAEFEEQFFTIDGKIKRLRDLVGDALPEPKTENLVSDSANIDVLEELLRKLIESHASLTSMKPNDDASLHEERSIEMYDKEEVDVDRYKKDLETALSELVHLKEERDGTLEKQVSLSGEIEALSKRTEELQKLLNQEEQKSTSVREKLNIAVRKGKLLVQQRDSLKQTIEEMSVQMEQLKSEINNRESTIAEHEQKLSQLSAYPDRLEALESESLLLKHDLEETKHHLQEKEYSLKLIVNKLGEIEVGGEDCHISDPVKKLEWVGKLCSDRHDAVASLEQESRKSKRASELLLAELNEVQERNDSFQEELAKVASELVDLRRERDSAETAKLEALSHLEKLSALHDEEKKSHFSEIVEFKSSMNQVWKGLGEVQNLLGNAFFMDLESFRNLEAGLISCMKGSDTANVVVSSVSKEHDGILRRSSDSKKGFISADSWSEYGTGDHYNDHTIVDFFHLFGHQLQEFLVEVNSLKERIHLHSSLAQEQDKTLLKLMTNIQREISSQRESCENMKKELSERDLHLVALRGNISCFYDSFINSVTVLENGKAELVGEKVASSDQGTNLKTHSLEDEISQECIKTMADRLLLAAKGFASIKTEFLDANQKEMKATITNLQRELQEKDVQRDKICSELVKQIKNAEASANSCSQELQSFRIQEQNLKTQVESIEAERKILEQRVVELQDRQGTAAELEDKMRSQTDLLAAKDQEIESLMHALDEEEIEMDELTKKTAELEKVVQQKNQEIENLESSRGKVMKKLSITVSKFDELHHLSANLLSEVEKLQSQLQEKDAEISFLRQEVTKCTHDVLLASQLGNQRSLDDVLEFLMWVDTIVSQDGTGDIHPDVKSDTQLHEYKEVLHKKLISLLSESENLRAVAESKDAMLQAERSKLAELNLKAETLEKSLHEKESQLNLLEGVEETGKRIDTSSEIEEVEPVMNEWASTGAFVAPQVRSLRKGNTDHVAIAVDVDPVSSSRIEDEDDDKVHGFKSLTSSKIVPRFTRPLTDMIDGLWVSCDRTLMRQPVLRLGIITYWAIMHALLAFFVV